MTTLEQIWTASNGYLMHARANLSSTSDHAPEVVLVHGLVVSSAYMMPLAEHLANDYRVFAPDLPGFGRSGNPRHVLSIPGLAASLRTWMDSTGVQRPLIIANSFGCQIAAEFAMCYPSRVRALVLVGPTVDPEARTMIRQSLRWLANAVNEPPSLGPILVLDYVRAGLFRTIGTIRVFISDQIEQKLPRIPVPTLVVRGARDPVVPQRWAQKACELLPSGKLAVIPGVGHTANYDAPLEIARLARIFDQHPRYVENAYA